MTEAAKIKRLMDEAETQQEFDIMRGEACGYAQAARELLDLIDVKMDLTAFLIKEQTRQRLRLN